MSTNDKIVLLKRINTNLQLIKNKNGKVKESMEIFSLSLLILTAILCIIILLSYLMFKNSNPLLISISVIPENSEVEINKKQQFRVIAKYSDITTSDITRFVKWSSTDDSILTIGKSGICTALKEGCAEVCARYCKVTAKALVMVKENI